MNIKQFIITLITITGFLPFTYSQGFTSLLGSTNIGGCKYQIYLPDYKVYFDKISKSDTLKKSTDSTCIIFIIKSCEGEIQVEEWYINNKGKKKSIKIKGNYMSSLDLFKRNMGKEDDFGEVEMFVQSYYEPLKTGAWNYYSKKGKLLKEEHYVKGIRKRTQKYDD